MKKMKWKLALGLLLAALSALLYSLHYAQFRDSHHIFIYLIGDVAFLPLEVLLVVLIVDGLLSAREKRAMLRKLNMVIGAFFSEVGTPLLKRLAAFDRDIERVRKELLVSADWPDREFTRLAGRLKTAEHGIDSTAGDLAALRSFLVGKRPFLLQLLGNPNLLEHESFTEVLWAVCHLAEELEKRGDVTKLPDTDYDHLSGDLKRVYASVLAEWVAYMKHLKNDYPYLFSLAVRTNPFDPDASPEVA